MQLQTNTTTPAGATMKLYCKNCGGKIEYIDRDDLFSVDCIPGCGTENEVSEPFCCGICEVELSKNTNFKDYAYFHKPTGEAWCDICTSKQEALI